MRRGALLLVTVVVVGGCVAPGDDPVSEATSPGIARPADLPLEKYAIDYPLYVAAVGVAVNDCLAPQGFAMPVSVWDTSRPEPTVMTRLGYIDLSPENAAVHGYRLDLDTRRVAWPPEGGEQSADEEAAIAACVDASVEVVPDYAESGNFVSDLDRQSQEIADAGPAVLEAVAAWRDCMGTPAVGDTTGGPHEYRISVLTAMDDMHYPGIGDTLHQPPPPGEVEAAVEDARCRVSSGYTRARLEAITESQERLIARHADRLAEVAATVEAIEGSIEELLTKDGR